MAIDTTNEKFAIIDWGDVWTDSIPISSDGLGIADKGILLWEYPNIPLPAPPPADPAPKFIIARGIGFSPGSVKFIVTHGLIAAPGAAGGKYLPLLGVG